MLNPKLIAFGFVLTYKVLAQSLHNISGSMCDQGSIPHTHPPGEDLVRVDAWHTHHILYISYLSRGRTDYSQFSGFSIFFVCVLCIVEF